MATKNKEEKAWTELKKEADEAISKLRTSVSRLTDDMHIVRTEMNKFKEAVQSDIQRLVEIRNKDINEIREQFAKK
tara:strand:- start:228 stop:455 length:228 start_codon:yes stop_codon:yes gene_type:complete